MSAIVCCYALLLLQLLLPIPSTIANVNCYYGSYQRFCLRFKVHLVGFPERFCHSLRVAKLLELGMRG